MTRSEALEFCECLESDWDSMVESCITIPSSIGYSSVLESGTMESVLDGLKAAVKKIYDTFHKIVVSFKNFVKSKWRKIYSNKIKQKVKTKQQSNFFVNKDEDYMEPDTIKLTTAEALLVQCVMNDDLDSLPPIEDINNSHFSKSRTDRGTKDTITVGEFNKFVDKLVELANETDKEIKDFIGTDVTKEEVEYCKERSKYLSACIKHSMQMAMEYVELGRDDTGYFNVRTFDIKFTRLAPKSVKEAIRSRDPRAVRKAILEYADSKSNVIRKSEFTVRNENPVSIVSNLSRYAESKGIQIYEPHDNNHNLTFGKEDWDYSLYEEVYVDLHKNFSKERIAFLVKLNAFLTKKYKDLPKD